MPEPHEVLLMIAVFLSCLVLEWRVKEHRKARSEQPKTETPTEEVLP